MKKKIVISDIDNCFLDSTEWFKHFPQKLPITREMWDEYHSKIDLVKGNADVIQIVEGLHHLGIDVVFLTAREDIDHVKEATIQQIEEYSNLKIDNEHVILKMRKANDTSTNAEMKEKILLNELKDKYDIILVIDDGVKNIEMFEKHGLNCVLYSKFGNT